MIIEATQTFSPGNIELLLIILNELEKKQQKTVVFLGHQYTYERLIHFNFKYIDIFKSSPYQTIRRFLSKRKDVLFFCSYPPFVKQKNSLVYFHSSFFINPFKFLKNNKISNKTKATRIFIYYLIKFFNKNVDYFYCQTKFIEQELLSSFNGIRVKINPFYNSTDLDGLKNKEKGTPEFDFFYPATPDVHKNYFKLFDAIKILGKQRKVILAVTIPEKALNYIEYLNDVNTDLGYNAIVNLGRVSKNEVLDCYLKSKAMIFPSLEESLGLPLIEATTIGCPIIGSDLPYIYNVVENPIVFNPLDINDIAEKMNRFLNNEFIINQKNKTENKVNQIINYFYPKLK